MKKIFGKAKAYIMLGAVSAGLLGAVIWNKVASYVQAGLSDSSSIRVSEKASCDESERDSNAKFSGCNSVL